MTHKNAQVRILVYKYVHIYEAARFNRVLIFRFAVLLKIDIGIAVSLYIYFEIIFTKQATKAIGFIVPFILKESYNLLKCFWNESTVW